MRLVGLTGGIASGKSTVSGHLESQGLPIVDADKVARVLFNPLRVCLHYEGFCVNFLSGFSVSSCQVIPCFNYFNQTHTKTLYPDNSASADRFLFF